MTVSTSTVVGAELAAVMPALKRPWYLTSHLVQLNAFLLVVLFSSAGLGFDGSMMNGLQSLDTWTSYFNHPSPGTLGVINGVLNLGPLVVPCIQFVCLFFLPESPRWLIGRGKVEAARAILVKYHAGGNEESPLVDYEIREITNHLLQQREVAAMGWSKLWQTRADKKRLAVVIYIAFMSQWAGNGLISYYLSLILNSIGITKSFDKTLINGILQIFNFGSAIFGALLVDPSGFGLLLACYPVEILPFQNRQKGMAISYVCNSLANLFNSFASPVAITAIGWKYYIVYIVLLAQFIVVAYLFFPETRGHSLEQIGHLFESRLITGRNNARPTTSLEDGKVEEAEKGGASKHVESVTVEEKSLKL